MVHRQAGEDGIAGWTIFLDTNGNEVWDDGETKTLTDNQGQFVFSDLGPGTYLVRETLESGWFATTATPSDIVAVSGADLNGIEFGNYAAASISGNVWQDRTANAAFDDGDDGLNGWTVFLDANDNGQLDGGETSVLTNSAGDFLLPNLGTGPHLVRVVQEPNWFQTTPDPLPWFPQSGEGITSVDFGSYDTDSHPWQNYRNHLDVDNDGWIVALDALLIINRLNIVGSGPLPVPPDEIPTPIESYFDTYADDYCARSMRCWSSTI